MRKLLMFVLAIAITTGVAFSQKKKDRAVLFDRTVEVETVAVGQDGTKFIKVWGFGKKVNLAIVQAKKNAIAACIFRGLPGIENAMPTPPLCQDPNAETQHAEYFAKFFETGGDYIKFINITTDGMPSGQDRREVKGGYKVAIYAQVMFDNLRKKLETDKIIRSLGSGF